MWVPREARKVKEMASPLGSPEGTSPMDTLILDFFLFFFFFDFRLLGVTLPES